MKVQEKDLSNTAEKNVLFLYLILLLLYYYIIIIIILLLIWTAGQNSKPRPIVLHFLSFFYAELR